jgi:hypothetical protein
MSYAKPTTSTQLYEFTNREQDLIRQAFNSKNFTFISKLPTSISPTRVSENYKLASIDNVSRRFSSVPKKTSDFQWIPDAYDLSKKKRNQDVSVAKEKQQRISPSNFKNPGNGKRLKYEDLDGKFFTYHEDGFTNAEQQSNRIKWLKQLKFVNKEFKSPVKNDYYISRIKSKEILSSLIATISADWPECKFSANFSDFGLIEVKFQADDNLNKKSLHSYMNMLHNRQEFLLRKDLSQWGVEYFSVICYSFLPPWVHVRSEVYSSLFPHTSSVSSSRTGKNVPGSQRSTLFNPLLS